MASSRVYAEIDSLEAVQLDREPMSLLAAEPKPLKLKEIAVVLTCPRILQIPTIPGTSPK
jgi:hypothetical protein